MTISADRRGWGPGWPHNNESKCVTIRSQRSGTALLVRKEVAPILQFLLDTTEARGYLLDFGPKDPLDDWGFCCRPIRGTSIASNHSWGLAVDLDASKYPQGQTRLHPPQWMIDLFKKYRFDNGVGWSNPDPMHFEFNGTPTDAAWLVASLAGHHIDGTAPPLPISMDPPDPAHAILAAILSRKEEDMAKVVELHLSNGTVGAYVFDDTSITKMGFPGGAIGLEYRAAMERRLGPAQVITGREADLLNDFYKQTR